MESLSKLDVTAQCPHCKLWDEHRFAPKHLCPHCHEAIFDFVPEGATQLGQCFVCGSPHLFRQKDFNRKLGIALVVVGVLLAYFTYGISLLVVAILDLAIYRSVGEVACCYRCESQYRGPFDVLEPVPPFNLSLHDYYRNMTRSISV